MSNQLVKAMPNPNLNVVEDREKIADPKIKDLQLFIARVSQLVQFINELGQFDRPLFFHKYPNLSKTYMVVLIIFVWTFDPRYFLSYVIFLLIVLFAVGHTSIARRMDPILYSLFWKYPNKYYRKSKHIKLVREFNLERDTKMIKSTVADPSSVILPE